MSIVKSNDVPGARACEERAMAYLPITLSEVTIDKFLSGGTLQPPFRTLDRFFAHPASGSRVLLRRATVKRFG